MAVRYSVFFLKRTGWNSKPKELKTDLFLVSVDETLMNHYWAKAARISLLLDSLIWKESISICYEGTLPWQFFCSPLPETPSRAGRRHNNTHKKEVRVIALEAASSEMKWLAWNYIGSHELNWALKPAFHTNPEKHLPISTLLFKAVFPFWVLLSAEHCGVLHSINAWGLATQMCVPQKWDSLPRGSPQCIPIGRITLLRLCHQRKCFVSKRLDVQTK